jgi:hypothetical protein
MYVNAQYCPQLQYAQFLLNRENYHKIPYYATVNLVDQISAFCILTCEKVESCPCACHIGI